MAIDYPKSNGDSLIVDFSDERLSLEVPYQGFDVEVRKLPLPDITTLPSTPEFTAIRLVANFEIYRADDPNQQVVEFAPPLQLAVSYTISDLFAASKAGKSLKLAYWDGQEWQLITPEKHALRILPPSTGAVATLQIARWADPSVSWGR